MHEHHSHHKQDNIKVAIALNLSFTVIEIIGGLLTNSLAILADALHDLGDSIALITAFLSEKAAQKQADEKRTFGYKRVSLVSALFSAVVLLIGSVFVLTKAIPRLFNPEAVNAEGMIFLAVIGIICNGAAVFRLKHGQTMNEKVLSWHLLEDVLGWGVLLIGSIIMSLFDVPILDPLLTIFFTAFILWGVAKNVKEIINIFLQGVPSHISLAHIREGLVTISGVTDAHDMHVWSLDGETDVFTGHIVVTDKALQNPEQTKQLIRAELKNHHIAHATIELESEKECKDKEYF